MSGTRRSIVVDARVNALPGAHGLARSAMNLLAHMRSPEDGLALRVLVNHRREQIFPLSALPAHADVIGTDVTVLAQHRSWELGRQLRALDPAVLYIPYPTFTPLVRPCPFVVTLHDCTMESSAKFAGGRIRRQLIKAVTATVLRRATAMTAPSRAALAEIQRYYPDAPNPTLIPWGVDTGRFGQRSGAAVAAARARYQLPDKFILTVGALRPHKNHEILVRAMAGISADVCLVIVGNPDPAFPDRLSGLIAELALESRVRLVPGVADEHLPAIYGAASAFALPSLAEGYGLPVLEAMAAGVPVVTSDIEVMAEVAGSAALRVPPRDVAGWVSALTAVLGDRRLADRLTAAGSAIAAAAGWEHGASALGSLLSAVAAGRVPRSEQTGAEPMPTRRSRTGR